MQNICMGIRHTFIQNMRFYRKKSGLTQEKLAEIIGMSTSYIGDMEARERFPSAETIDKIASALNVPASVLFSENGSPEAINSSFEKLYSETLKENLSRRVQKAVEDACDSLTAEAFIHKTN